MNVFEELKATAERHSVARKELCADPDMQMRAELDHSVIEQYAENIEEILSEHPIEIVIVETALDEVFYIVDGFHRYFAAIEADMPVVDVVAYRGTYEQAIQYAMSANFKNGMRPNSNDQRKAVSRLLSTAPDFGYDSKLVNKWVASFGIPNSTARNYTSPMLKEIDDKRDAKIMELHEEGLSNRAIAKEVGVTAPTVAKSLESVKNRPLDKSLHPEESPTDHQDTSPFFDEEETEELDIVNPADAFNKALQEQASEAEDTIVTPNDPTSGNDDYIGDTLRELLSVIEKDPASLTAAHKFLIKKLATHA